MLKLMEIPPTSRIADKDDCPQLDVQTFDRYDTQLIDLGFEPEFDYASESPISRKISGLTRTYYHPAHRCVARNGQLFQGNTTTGTVFVLSKLDDNWFLSSRNSKPHAIECMWRRPRSLWNAIHGAEPDELLGEHLRMRQRMIDGLGVSNVSKRSEYSVFFERLTEFHRENREILRDKNFILLYLECIFYKRKPICLWMGDLEKAVKNRQAF